jgi:formate-nitrite transporter family protein
MEASVRLNPPVGRRDHIQGYDHALVTLVEYGDFQCPTCGRAFPMIQELQKTFGTNLRFVFRHFPLRQVHPQAEIAAQASEAASAQGKFWEIHNLFYQNQFALRKEDIIQYAEQLDLDVEEFNSALEQKLFAKRVTEDFRNGIRSGVNATPTLFINGYRYEGALDFENLSNEIQREIDQEEIRRAL